MVRYLTWVANTLLFALCCFLVAGTANAIIAAWLTPDTHAALAPRSDAGSVGRSWNDRKIIVGRNLFHSAELTAEAEQPEMDPEEEIEETQLPLKLWGTIYSPNPKLAWASVQDESDRGSQAIALKVGEEIQGAKVLSIERERVVLLENGVRRALNLDDESPLTQVPSASNKRSSRSRSRSARSRNRPSRRASVKARADERAAKSMAERVKKIAENRFEVEREDIREAMSDPSALYNQARILPHVDENGQISGVEISAIKPGSVFEQVGIEEGDIITEIGGVPINDVTQSGAALAELMNEENWSVTFQKPDGTTQEAVFQTPDAGSDE